MPYCPVTRVLAPIFGQVHLPWSPAFLPSEATLRAPACPQRLRSPFSGRGNRSSGARASGGEERGGAGRAGGRGISCVTEGIGCTTGGDNGDKWWRRGLFLASLVATTVISGCDEDCCLHHWWRRGRFRASLAERWAFYGQK